MTSVAPDVCLIEVVKEFPELRAVDGISLEIPRGSFFALLGPSGCGKTTTLRMIGGFEEPTSGQILLADRDVVGLPPYKRDVNTVFQSYALFPHMTVGANIAILARYALVSGLDLHIDLEADSILYSTVAGLGAGLLGALYPALRAASQDPVKALSYE